MLITACATLVPPESGIVRAPEVRSRVPSSRPAALAVLGDVGIPMPAASSLVRGISDRLMDAPEAPLLILGDVFYRDGLLGVCPAAGDPPRSKRGCPDPTDPSDQLERVFEPYRRGLPARAIVALAGNHDHRGDPDSTANACALFPRFEPGWKYLAAGCGLSGTRPVETLDLGSVVVFLVDSERMIQDSAFRRASTDALGSAIAEARRDRPAAWRVIATHHPLETYGLHNGAHPLTAIRKDLYWVSRTALLPLSWTLEKTLLHGAAHQDVYTLRYRAFRRAMYRTLRREPVDLVVSGHDHSMQLVEIDHPGVRVQVISGAAAYQTPIKRFGQDLFLTNRLARLVGLGGLLPAPAHRLLFGAGPEAGGFAVLVPDRPHLMVEFYAADSPEPLAVYEIGRETH